MKKTKKILSLVLVVMMLVSAVPFVVNATEYKVGDIIQFGSYPQSKVTDSGIISKLNSLAPSWDNWTSYGYYAGTGDYGTMVSGDWMRYTDVSYNGFKYRGVKFTQYRPEWTFSKPSSSYQDNNDYNPNVVYWFKFEPIDWIILDPSKGFVISKIIIDSQPYSNTCYYYSSDPWGTYSYFNDPTQKNYASDYETSSIRRWLNNNFYSVAFSNEEKEKISSTNLNNESYYTALGEGGYTELDSNFTTDKIFLLSLNESRNFNYGFATDESEEDASRCAVGSDYAKNQGLYSPKDSANKGNWLIRTPGMTSQFCSNVSYEGFVNCGCLVFNTSYGVRPALCCDIDKIINNNSGNSDIETCLNLSINTPNKNIEYDLTSSEYTPEKIPLSIKFVHGVKAGFIESELIKNYEITFDKLEICLLDNETTYSNILYFKDGWFGLGKTQKIEKTFDSPITLKGGRTFTFDEDLTAFISNEYQWGENEFKKDIRICAYAYNNNTLLAKDEQVITIKNKSAEKLKEYNKKIEEASKQAASILDTTACIIESEFLSEIFTKEQMKAIQNAIQCKIALCALPKSTYKKAGISDKIIEKLMEKAGVKKDMLGMTYTADISLKVKVDTEKYGQLEVDFILPTTYYSLGDNDPFAATTFDIKYEIIGGKNIPKDNRKGNALGLGVYADKKNFYESAKTVALSQLEYAYEFGYGENVNKVGDLLFGETISKILSKTNAGSYSHLTFSMMTFPSTKMNIFCPVDVYVYDVAGNLCASVENNEITMMCDEIDIEVVGDKKYLTIYEDKYSIEIIATAYDDMRIEIEEYACSDKMMRKVLFEDIELNPMDSFKTNIDDNHLNSTYQILKNEEEVISNDRDDVYIHYVKPIEIIDKEATCNNEGTYHIECEDCAEILSTGTIATKEHTNTSWIIDLNPTCVKEGSKHIECAICEEILKTETIAKLSHSYNSVATVPTCTEQGYTTHTCECGDTYREIIPATGHTFDGSACINCDYDKVDDCSCNCHKGGIVGFFFKIINFFQKLFGMNKVCECGAKH